MSKVRRRFSRFVSCQAIAAMAFVFSMIAVEAATCPVSPPQPLRMLYQQSEKIVVAKLDAIVEDKVIEEKEDYTTISLRQVFSVVSTLKGKAEPSVVIYQTDYREKTPPAIAVAETEQTTEPSEPEETQTVDIEEAEDRFKVGKQLLLFLQKDDEGDGYSLVDYRFGAKDLSDADLRVYEKRIGEIAEILASPEKQTERTIEWLVRCAEEPATRWEGAYELDTSFDLLEQQIEREAEEKAARERGEVKIQQTTSEGQIILLQRLDFYGFSGNADFARGLNERQKTRLTEVLLDSFEAGKTKNKSDRKGLTTGDSALLDLVGRWDKGRLVPTLLANLRNSGVANAEDAGQFMRILANILDDEKLQSVTENYEEVAYGDDDEPIDSESEEAETVSETDAAKADAASENKSETAETTAQKPTVENQEKMTYKQRREQLINEFIAECETALARAKGNVARTQKH